MHYLAKLTRNERLNTLIVIEWWKMKISCSVTQHMVGKWETRARDNNTPVDLVDLLWCIVTAHSIADAVSQSLFGYTYLLVAPLWRFWAPWWPSPPAATITHIHCLIAAAICLPYVPFLGRFHLRGCRGCSHSATGFVVGLNAYTKYGKTLKPEPETRVERW
jgi:hypothetical protein